MERRTVTEADEGKRLVNASGERLGTVTEVQAGTAYVDVEPDLTDTIRSKLGWGAPEQEDYALQQDLVDVITDDEIRLKQTLQSR